VAVTAQALWPSLTAPALVALLSAARFECGRWIRAQNRGMRLRFGPPPALAHLTAWLCIAFLVLFTVTYGLDRGAAAALGLVVAAVAGAVAWDNLVPEKPMVSAAAAALVWPLMVALALLAHWSVLF
jgi:hypothetical protein